MDDSMKEPEMTYTVAVDFNRTDVPHGDDPILRDRPPLRSRWVALNRAHLDRAVAEVAGGGMPIVLTTALAEKAAEGPYHGFRTKGVAVILSYEDFLRLKADRAAPTGEGLMGQAGAEATGEIRSHTDTGR
jgi:hypothetical protein